MPDERSLTAEELGRLERSVRGVVEDRRDDNAMVEWGAEELFRLGVEDRHLRDLVKRVQPFTVGLYGAARNSEDEKELLGLEQELKAEVDRKGTSRGCARHGGPRPNQ